jgi:hypothetical protein
MVDDKNLRGLVMIAGASVPAHMLARLHDAGMMVLVSEVSDPTTYDVRRDLLVEPEYLPLNPTWYDEASDITREMYESLKGYRDVNTVEFGGIRAGKTEAMLRAIQEEMGLIDHAGPDYIYDGMGFRSVRPPVAPRREIQFIDTPKPMTRRKARRQRAQRKAKP